MMADSVTEMGTSVTHVKGELRVRNPTVGALEMLLAKMIHDPRMYDAERMAQLVMKYLQEPASIQLGPGLEAITQTREGENLVRLKWEFWTR